ncbi:MAG TPA: hypothetical protein VJT73_20980 [Polyangiaceae bacterium]|nr:hypothetical protein [Polyangiaceae bacterium]
MLLMMTFRRTLTAPSLAALALFGPTTARSEVAERFAADRNDVARLTAQSPELVQQLEQGEALMRRGQIAQAAEVFAQASRGAPASALLARRECQALTLLDRHAEAVAACRRALAVKGGSAMDHRAMVAALLSGDHLPMPHDVSEASQSAKSAREAMPTQPFGHASVCEMAERLGDLQLLDHCVSELRYMAPEHPETQHYAAALAKARWTWRPIAVWAGILLASVATLVHAIARRVRRASRALAVAAGCLALLSAAPALAAVENEPSEAPPPAPQGQQEEEQRLTDWEIVNSDPESKLPSPKERDEDPVTFGQYLMDMSYKAEKAAKKGDHAAAVKFFRALAKLVPEHSVAFSKACIEYEALDDWQNAVDFCRTALAREGVKVEDYKRFARLLLAKKTSLSSVETDDLAAIVDHLKAEPATVVDAAQIQCELGIKVSNAAHLEQCTQVLTPKFPDDPRTTSYRWALALKRGDYAEAGRLIDRAEQLSMPADAVTKMRQATQATEPLWRRTLRSKIAAGGLIVLVLAGGLLLVTRARRPTGPVAHT